MLNIWSVKKKQQQEAAGPKVPKRTAAHIRLQKDTSELEDYATMEPIWEDYEKDPLHFTLTVMPDEGMYQGGVFRFTFEIPENYPHDQPKVKCTQKIYHPNIDLEGNICLNILREDWKPVLNLNSVFVGLQYLFLEPNADDPLNKDAAEVLRRNRDQFVRNVKSAMAGGSIDGVQYNDVRGMAEDFQRRTRAKVAAAQKNAIGTNLAIPNNAKGEAMEGMQDDNVGGIGEEAQNGPV